MFAIPFGSVLLVARALFRLWKRRSLKQRELREQRQFAAYAALSSLSMGPPIYLQKDVGFFNILLPT